MIKGIDENDEEGETSVSIVAPVSGEFSFHWCYTTEDEDPSYDPAFYINGVYTQLTDDSGLNFQNGTQTISVSAGDEIGFSVFTDDGCCGSGILVVDEFVSPGGTSCTPTCTGDLDEDGLIGGSDLLLFLAAFGTTCGQDVLVD